MVADDPQRDLRSRRRLQATRKGDKPVRFRIKQMLDLLPILAGIVWLTLVAGEAAAPRTAAASGVTEGIVTLPGSQIQYFSRGQGETIVLLPGGTLTVGYLDGLADALANAGYRVVGINFRGSGKSTGSREGVTLQTNADDVAGVVNALTLGPVHMGLNPTRMLPGAIRDYGALKLEK
jgi:hypothetical protein